MYCPKCSMKLYKEDKHYVCSSGKLEYSRSLSDALDKFFIEKETKDNIEDDSGKYFCPQYSKPLDDYYCKYCDVSIKDIIHELIEMHIHKFFVFENSILSSIFGKKIPCDTLEKIENIKWPDPDFESHLVTECHRLRKVPLSEFTIENLRIMVAQNISTSILVPIAIDILKINCWLEASFYEGDLLESVVSINMDYWKNNIDELANIQPVMKLAIKNPKFMNEKMNSGIKNIVRLYAETPNVDRDNEPV